MAEIYMDHWEQGYSGNNARFTVGLFKELEEKGIIRGNIYADLASGPLILDRSFSMYGSSAKPRSVYSLDLSSDMIKIGSETHAPSAQPHVGSITDTSEYFESGQFDAVNIGLAIEYTSNNLHIKQQSKSERVQALTEANRVLKPEGVMVITLTTNSLSNTQFDNFRNAMGKFGFTVLDDYTGLAVSNDDEDRKFENYTIVCRKTGIVNLDGLNLQELEMTRCTVPTKGGTQEKPKDPVENSGSMHRSFVINKVQLGVDFAPETAGREIDFEQKYNLSYQLLKKMYEDGSMTLDKVTNEERIMLRQTYGIICYSIEEDLSPAGAAKKGKKKQKTATKKKYYFSLTLDPSRVFECDFAN
jgi:SAM-dependent methyltransferase